VRKAALEALSVRREADTTGELSGALRYPWPSVARNAADAVVALKRTDMIPRLIQMLDEPDPRAPRVENGRLLAPEVVRINHLRSCLLCHAPAEAGKVPDGVLVAETPLPSESLSEGRGYSRTESNLLVRIDVTYLRQDFSVVLGVKEQSAWPAMQRFDFVVRKRAMTPVEAADLRVRLTPKAGEGSPYQEAALSALRRLTGLDLPAKAAAWREALGLEAS
jgi:hypothetical protein